MTQRLKGKSAVVTGSGDGIGREVALAMALEGAQIVVNDIGRDASGKSSADKVVEEITRAKGLAVANYDSVATMQGGENIIKTAVSNFGRIDILANCAGNFKVKPIVEFNEADWDSIMQVHLKGHFSCSKAAAAEMIKQKSGRIINISSRAAAHGKAVAYGTAKAGILGFTSTLSQELKDYGITVNAILPSAQTKLFPGGAPATTDNIPVPAVRTPDCIAPIIVFLATDEAKGITGRYIYTSGGDICIYGRPLRLNGEASTFIRKSGKWTIDELMEFIPSMT
jgi:NAD(P)-dependent dehydrogenase (short-subunit alcohol dehydrogenase family)